MAAFIFFIWETPEVLANGAFIGVEDLLDLPGLIFVVLFLLLGLAHMVLIRSAIRFTALLAAADAFAFLTLIYGGFAMTYVNGIALWNSALLPVLYVASGLWGGAEVTLGIALGSGGIGAGGAIEEWIRLLLIGYIFLIPVYLMSGDTRHRPVGSRYVT